MCFVLSNSLCEEMTDSLFKELTGMNIPGPFRRQLMTQMTAPGPVAPVRAGAGREMAGRN